MKPPLSIPKSLRRWLLLPVLLMLVACGEVTVVVDKLPDEWPANERIYATGNFNYWDPGDRRYELLPIGKGKWAVTLPKGWGQLEYKFTRGDWTTVEVQACGEGMPNRVASITGNDTVHAQIASWHDMGLRNCQRVTLLVRPPADHSMGAPVYVAGNFNNWTAGDPAYRLNLVDKNLYRIVLDKGKQSVVEYKFTRGGWESEEYDEYGNPIENRVFTFGSEDTVHCSIPHWKDRLRPGGDSVHIVVQTPANTPPGQHVYVAGLFNNWSSSAPGYKMRWLGNGKFGIAMYAVGTSKLRPFEFKFTRGSWNSVEVDARGNNVENRKVYSPFRDTLHLQITAWRDLIK